MRKRTKREMLPGSHRYRRSLSLLASLVLAATAQAQQNFTFTSVVDSTGPLKEFDALFPSINNRGEVVFHAKFPAGGGQPAGQGIYVTDGSSYRGIAVTGGVYTGFFANPAINDNGLVAFQASGPSGSEGVFLGDGRTMDNRTVATNRSGRLFQFSPVIRFSDYGLGIAADGTVAFLAQFQTSRKLGAFAGNGLAQETQLYPPPGSSESNLSQMTPATNARGDVVLRAGPELLRTNVAGGPMIVIATTAGDSAFASFDSFSINDAGTVAFVAQRKSGGYGLYTGDGGSAPTHIVDTTQQPQFSRFRTVSINNTGSIAFGANFTNGSSNIFVINSGGAKSVLQPDLFGSTVSGFYADVTPRALNDAGQLVFWYRLANGRQGIAVATPNNGVESRRLGNISTRLPVQTGESVLIGGFIVTSGQPKRLIIRAIGPSLGQAGVSGALADPVLELISGDGTLLASNDNWRESQEAEIRQTGVQPSNDLESAIVRTLEPGNYTAVLRGRNDGTGVGLVEAYDLTQTTTSRLANISTRGFVDLGENVLIGGFIVGPYAKVVVRAIGPSLANAGVNGVLQNPTLEVIDSNGSEVAANDDWKSSQRGELEALAIQPTDERESALIATLASGNYTAIVRGAGDTTGVGLVEVYNIE